MSKPEPTPEPTRLLIPTKDWIPHSKADSSDYLDLPVPKYYNEDGTIRSADAEEGE